MKTPKEKIKRTILEVIDNLDGLAFRNSYKYSQKEKVFFEGRYSKIISLLPEIEKYDVGIEIGLGGGIMAFLLKRIFLLEKLFTLEHPSASSMFTEEYLKSLEINKIILKRVDLHSKKLPWPSDFFDFVIFSEVMEHLIPADVPVIIQEMKRVLKKNGWLLVTTPNITSLIKRINLLLGKNPVEFDLRLHEGATYGHIREYTMPELIKILDNDGFKIIKKDYFMIDEKRNYFTRIESLSSKIFPSFANSLGILAKK